MESLGDLLFELSNDDRRRILLSIRDKPKRLTQISHGLGLTVQEASRQLSRLEEVGLEYKDVKGFHHLTPYGELVLRQLRGFEFTSQFREYFMTHSMEWLSDKLVDRVGDLTECLCIDNAMDFLRHAENLLKESKEHVSLIVDQFPMNSLTTIVEAIDRGVQFRIIEPRDRVFNPDLNVMTSEETQALSRTRRTPLAEQRMVDGVNVQLFLSENRCVLAFPTSDGQYDYKGFTATDDSSLRWCGELFQSIWDEAVHFTPTAPSVQVRRGRVSRREALGLIFVVGRENPDVDAQAVQDAVDNYDEVILKGKFNLGTSTVQINRSVVLRGEGRENDIPSAKVYKRGWTFPSYVPEFLLVVDGEGIDVTIENIHFTDFNYCCIRNRLGNSVKIRHNRITLETGRGRGMSLSNREDQVIGILSGGAGEGGFPGDILIEGNYFDFALVFRGGFYSRWLETRERAGIMRAAHTDPNYRPDLKNHESYCGVGVALNFNLGRVIVRDNIVRNMNSRGIYIMDNYESADIQVVGNTIVSDVYGAYPFSSHIAGIGIHAQSSWAFPRSGTRVEISENEIRCDKLNYCGIAVYGQSMYQEGAGKLGACIVRDNTVHLEDGHVGVLIRKNDGTEVYGNKISGRAYYGFHLWGSEDREGFDLGSNENLVEDNDMTDLLIKAPDEYSDGHVDGRMFTGSEGKSATAHVWLNAHSRGNVIKVKADETVIDKGEDNTITYSDDE